MHRRATILVPPHLIELLAAGHDPAHVLELIDVHAAMVPSRRHSAMIAAIVPLLTAGAVSLSTPALGEPIVPPTTLTFKRNEAWNLHDTMGGAHGRRLQSAVSLVLERGGRARVEDSGSSSDSGGGEHFTEERTTWTTRWRGRWKHTGTRLRLSLRREQRDCKKTVVERALGKRAAERAEPCKPGARSLALDCEQETLPLTDQKDPASVLAWSCYRWPDPASGSRLPWIFGQSRCLEASGGPHGRSGSLRPCSARTK